MAILMMLLHVDKYIVYYKSDNDDDVAEEDYYLPCLWVTTTVTQDDLVFTSVIYVD